MRTLVLCLALAGVGALLPCPGGQPCPPTPVLSPQASCPLPEDVPCAGSHHCCPQGSHCSPDGQSCLVSPAPRAIPCPDGQSECPDDATCCVTASGAWGCCPMPQASCCADKVHCCPHDTICDLAHERCLSLTGDNGTATPLGTIFPSWKRQPPAPVALGKVPCPDGRSACPEGATCCHLPSEQYGCCPLQNAVCCSDGQHCCPQGTACDLERSTCTSTGTPTPLPKAGDVKCDDQTSCPDGSTCCRLSTGAWGCCPLEQATCCRDHLHCCPRGYTCNLAEGSCEKLLTPTLLLPAPPPAPCPPPARPPASLRTPNSPYPSPVPCDAAHACPKGQRCCHGRGTSWGCCPFIQGSCCPDGRHCCPKWARCTARGWGCSPQRWDLPPPLKELL